MQRDDNIMSCFSQGIMKYTHNRSKKQNKKKQKQKNCEIPTPPPPQQRNKCCKTQPIDPESNKKINCTKFYKIRWNSS